MAPSRKLSAAVGVVLAVRRPRGGVLWVAGVSTRGVSEWDVDSGADAGCESVVSMTAVIPSEYRATLDELKRHVHAARFQAQRKVNTELLRLWWRIGTTILERQQREP